MEEALANKLRAEQRILGGVDTASLATPRGATKAESDALASLPYSDPQGRQIFVPKIDSAGDIDMSTQATQRDIMELQVARIRANQQGLEGADRLSFIANNTNLDMTGAEYLDAVVPMPFSEEAAAGLAFTPGEAQVLEPSELAIAPQAPGRAISSREAMEVLSLLRSRMGM